MKLSNGHPCESWPTSSWLDWFTLPQHHHLGTCFTIFWRSAWVCDCIRPGYLPRRRMPSGFLGCAWLARGRMTGWVNLGHHHLRITDSSSCPSCGALLTPCALLLLPLAWSAINNVSDIKSHHMVANLNTDLWKHQAPARFMGNVRIFKRTIFLGRSTNFSFGFNRCADMPCAPYSSFSF